MQLIQQGVVSNHVQQIVMHKTIVEYVLKIAQLIKNRFLTIRVGFVFKYVQLISMQIGKIINVHYNVFNKINLQTNL
jgi:hypothetical protein